jgi:hypothetical protein
MSKTTFDSVVTRPVIQSAVIAYLRFSKERKGKPSLGIEAQR